MKTALLLCISCFFLTFHVSGQFNHPVSLFATANLDVGMRELANVSDNSGYGMSLSASFFSRNKLQFKITSGVKSFFGNKVYIISDEGRENKNAAIYTFTAGPQYFISKRIALSIESGPAWHAILTKGFSVNAVYEITASGFFGKQRRIVTQIFFAEIPKPVVDIRYAGVAFGYRIF